MRIIIACEESQVLTKLFRDLGHDCYSNDLKPGKINPLWHLKGDIFTYLDMDWDLMIAHPPCTRLTVTGNKWYKPEFAERFPNIEQEREEAVEFFMKLALAPIKHIAIENPIGIMSSRWRKPDQIIQPWYFGDKSRKSTCLWLKNLPKLVYCHEDNLFETKTTVEPDIVTFKSGATMSRDYYEATCLPSYERSEVRSKTYDGIGNAIADQWSEYLLRQKRK